MTSKIAIGVGCRRACPVAALRAVIDEACAGLDLVAARLFTLARKRSEEGLHEVAAALGLPLIFLQVDDLAAVTDRIVHVSLRVGMETGVPSIAEAAALVGAGPGGRLIVPRVAHAAATCAVAIGVEG